MGKKCFFKSHLFFSLTLPNHLGQPLSGFGKLVGLQSKYIRQQDVGVLQLGFLSPLATSNTR